MVSLSYIFIRHELNQNAAIDQLFTTASLLNERVKKLQLTYYPSSPDNTSYTYNTSARQTEQEGGQHVVGEQQVGQQVQRREAEQFWPHDTFNYLAIGLVERRRGHGR